MGCKRYWSHCLTLSSFIHIVYACLKPFAYSHIYMHFFVIDIASHLISIFKVTKESNWAVHAIGVVVSPYHHHHHHIIIVTIIILVIIIMILSSLLSLSSSSRWLKRVNGLWTPLESLSHLIKSSLRHPNRLLYHVRMVNNVRMYTCRYICIHV
jgi:hypothetical protein